MDVVLRVTELGSEAGPCPQTMLGPASMGRGALDLESVGEAGTDS